MQMFRASSRYTPLPRGCWTAVNVWNTNVSKLSTEKCLQSGTYYRNVSRDVRATSDTWTQTQITCQRTPERTLVLYVIILFLSYDPVENAGSLCHCFLFILRSRREHWFFNILSFYFLSYDQGQNTGFLCHRSLLIHRYLFILQSLREHWFSNMSPFSFHPPFSFYHTTPERTLVL